MPESNEYQELLQSVQSKDRHCRRCKAQLAHDQPYICINCDLEVGRLLRARHTRDKTEAYQRRLKEAELPKGTRETAWSLEGYAIRDARDTGAVNAIAKWAGEKHPKIPTLFITGPSGSGKSHLAVAGLKKWIWNHERGGLFVVAPDLMFTIRSADDQAAVLKMLKFAPALVIDEMGLENISDFTAMIWHSILSFRGPDQECLPTIITSNLNLDQLAARWTVKKEKEEEGEPPELRSQRVTRRIADYGLWLELTRIYKDE